MPVPRGLRRGLISLAIVGVSVLCPAQPDLIADASTPVEELLISFDGETFAIAQHAMRPGKLPELNLSQVTEGCWVVQVEDTSGTVRYTSMLRDPTVRYAGQFDQGQTHRGLTHGSAEHSPPVTFVLVLPRDPILTRVSFFRLARSLDLQALTAAAASAIVSSSGPQASVPPALLPADALELVGTLILNVP